MAKIKRKPATKDSMEVVESTFSRTERFIEENQKLILYVLVGILVVVLGIIGYVKFIRQPHIERSWNEAYKAEFYFEKDSFRLALYGDGFFPGFIDIIDEYGSTPMGNAAKFYAGVCYMRFGEYDEALSVLKKFKSKDPMVGAMALALVGDAHAELGDFDAAVKYYLRADKHASNELISPAVLMKAAAILEIIGDYSQALDLYRRIESEYYGSSEQHNIAKYKTRAELLGGK